MNKKYSEIAFVLDRSGSMGDCREAALTGFNLFLQEQQQTEGLAKLTLYGMRSRGEGPPSFRVQGRVKYRRCAVEQWLKDQEAAEQDRLVKMQASRA